MSRKEGLMRAAAGLTVAAACVGVASASITVPVVPVGNVGNAGITSGYQNFDGSGPVATVGAVNYTYSIGQSEITAGQYTAFLNAVAADDTYGLYNSGMTTSHGCQIIQSGAPGSYTYSVAGDRANRPVNFVNWGSAARFANWMNNGQPTGAQTAGTTEDGAYTLNGATSPAALNAVTRNAGWSWALPSEDEWVKAGYYNGSSSSYYTYPTSNNSAPSNTLSNPAADPGNNANYTIVMGPSTIGAPYWFTEVGDFENTLSPYGCYDMGGNVSEWNEALMDMGMGSMVRGARGSDATGFGGSNAMKLSFRMAESMYEGANTSSEYIGFRVVAVPEPSALALLGFGALLAARRR